MEKFNFDVSKVDDDGEFDVNIEFDAFANMDEHNLVKITGTVEIGNFCEATIAYFLKLDLDSPVEEFKIADLKDGKKLLSNLLKELNEYIRFVSKNEDGSALEVPTELPREVLDSLKK